MYRAASTILLPFQTKRGEEEGKKTVEIRYVVEGMEEVPVAVGIHTVDDGYADEDEEHSADVEEIALRAAAPRQGEEDGEGEEEEEVGGISLARLQAPRVVGMVEEIVPIP